MHNILVDILIYLLVISQTNSDYNLPINWSKMNQLFTSASKRRHFTVNSICRMINYQNKKHK